jgi:hypothetical protein
MADPTDIVVFALAINILDEQDLEVTDVLISRLISRGVVFVAAQSNIRQSSYPTCCVRGLTAIAPTT